MNLVRQVKRSRKRGRLRLYKPGSWVHSQMALPERRPALMPGTQIIMSPKPVTIRLAGGLFPGLLNDGPVRALSWTPGSQSREGRGAAPNFPRPCCCGTEKSNKPDAGLTDWYRRRATSGIRLRCFNAVETSTVIKTDSRVTGAITPPAGLKPPRGGRPAAAGAPVELSGSGLRRRQ